MPIEIVEGRNKKTKNLYLRGSYLGIAVDRSCKTDRRSVARSLLAKIQGEIERGEYPPKEAAPVRGELTFIGAANAYMKTGGSPRYVSKLIKHFGATPLAEIGQTEIDSAAAAIYPHGAGAYRNRAVHTPMSAIRQHAGIDAKLKRPKGAKGRIVTDWLTQDDAFGIVASAESFDAEYALLLKFLLYTGVRLGAALNLNREDVRASELEAWVRHQKGQPAADVRLREDLRDALVAHLKTHNRQRVFRLHQGGHLKHQLVRAKLGYLGLPCPVRRPKGWKQPPNRLSWANHHTFRHTWATWMRKYGGADVKDLVASGNWRDERSASRYTHAETREAWSKVDQLPGRKWA